MEKIIKCLLFCGLFSASVQLSAHAGNRPAGSDNNLDKLIEKLDEIGFYCDSATFVVGMPQLAEDVIYKVSLSQYPSENDKISSFSYLIDWKMVREEEAPTGFSAYFDGNHYRYGGSRLQEYHWSWDSIPFMSERVIGGIPQNIQSTAQFADLLPAMLAGKMRSMRNDSSFVMSVTPDTIVAGNKSFVVSAVMIVNGITSSEQEYVFDAATLLPSRLHFENSPGSISEQTVDVVYSKSDVDASQLPALSEEYLMSIYPDIFANFRESNFRIENLPGTKLPAFALQNLAGERMTHRKGESFSNPVVIALLDPAGGFNADFIAAVRQGVGSLPFPADIIWAFTGSNADRIEEQIGSNATETALLSARGLARDCGVSSFPVTIMVSRNGIVKSVLLGYNGNLSSDIIQNMALIND